MLKKVKIFRAILAFFYEINYFLEGGCVSEAYIVVYTVLEALKHPEIQKFDFFGKMIFTLLPQLAYRLHKNKKKFIEFCSKMGKNNFKWKIND